MHVLGEGPIPARVMIVGDMPAEADFRFNLPFGGSAGEELNRLLRDAGVERNECYVTYVLKGRVTNPLARAKKDIQAQHVLCAGKYVLPEVVAGRAALLAEIQLVQPNVIVAMGDMALGLLTEHWSVATWRGSMLLHEGIKVIPTYHPSTLFKQFDLRSTIVADLRRVQREMRTKSYENVPAWNFIIRPSIDQVMATLAMLEARAAEETLWLDLDIETRYYHIDCIGFSWSRTDALCIPLVARGRPEGYWSLEEETAIIFRLYQLFTNPGVRIRWQNGLYDAQFILRHWHFLPNHGQDTMISQHSLFAALPKSLDYLASLYAQWYVYWKDEGSIEGTEEARWRYNLQDCVYTREVGEVLAGLVVSMGMQEVEATQQALFHPVLRAMTLGVRVSPNMVAQLTFDIQEALSVREAFLFNLFGHPVNCNSSKQLQTLFYEDLQQPVIRKRGLLAGRMVMKPTCNDEALQVIGRREPLLQPICNSLADMRTLNKFLGSFILMPLDTDKRMRCSFNIAGDAAEESAPYSYRLSSSKNIFGSGGNLQTIPSEKSKSSGKAAARGSLDFKLPNIRKMYVPDEGFTFFDMDLSRADLQVVVWEADDSLLKAALANNVDVHLLSAFELAGREPPPLEELVGTHQRYPDHLQPMKHKREFAKVFCHATNYLGKAKTIAMHTGSSVHAIERAQQRWFEMHPGILAWHNRVKAQVTKHRFVENAFGYRWYIFNRIDEQLLPKAVAWIPQSTVGVVINKIWLNVYRNIPQVQVLLQCHDSISGQFPSFGETGYKNSLLEQAKIIVPYEDPLIISVSLATSRISWGDCA